MKTVRLAYPNEHTLKFGLKLVKLWSLLVDFTNESALSYHCKVIKSTEMSFNFVICIPQNLEADGPNHQNTSYIVLAEGVAERDTEPPG